jgi:hypothetical protein
LKDSLDFLSRQDQGAMPSRARENGKRKIENSDKEGKKSKPSSNVGKRKNRSKGSKQEKKEASKSSLKERREEGGSYKKSSKKPKTSLYSDEEVEQICLDAIINRKTMDQDDAFIEALRSSKVDLVAMREHDLNYIKDAYYAMITRFVLIDTMEDDETNPLQAEKEKRKKKIKDETTAVPIELIEDIDKEEYKNPAQIEKERRKAKNGYEEVDAMEEKDEEINPDILEKERRKQELIDKRGKDPMEQVPGTEPLITMDTSDQALEEAEEMLRIQKLKEAHAAAVEITNMRKEENDIDIDNITEGIQKTAVESKTAAKTFKLIKKAAIQQRKLDEINAMSKMSFVGPGAIGMGMLKQIIKDARDKVMSPTEIVRLLSSLVTALKEYKDSLPENKDTVEPGYTDPEIEAITQQVNTLWDYAHTQYPHFFRSGQESDAEFVKRMNSLLQRREKLLQSLTVDTDPDKLAKIKDELASIQTTLDANEDKYKEVNEAVYDVKEELKLTDQVHNFPKEKYDAPNFREVEATFNENNKILKSLANSMSSESEKEFPDPLKLEELREKWHNIYDTGYAKEYSDQLVKQGLIKQENVAYFRQEVTKDIDKLVSMVAEKLFKVHMEGESYMLIDRLGEIFNEYYTIREKLSKDKQNKAIFEETDWKWATQVEVDLLKLSDKIDTFSKPIRDEQKIITDINMRAKYMEDLMKKQKDFQNKEGFLYSPERHEKDAYKNIVQSEKNVRAEFAAKEIYNVLTKDFPKNYPDAVMRLESEVINLKTAIREDISSFGPFLHQVVNQMYDRFRSQIQNVNAQDRARFDAAIESEKKFLQKIVTKEAYSRTGAKLLNATKDGRLQKYVLDPTTFSEHDREAMMMYTPVGLYMSETRRLLDLVSQTMDLRKRMVIDVHKTLNMEGNPDAVKFDVVLSNLFPPSQVELKLRYLLTLPPDARKKYENGRFVQAVKMIDANFDISTVGNDNFLEVVSTIGQSSKSFLQDIVGATPISWSDFESMGNELVRSQTAILSQVRDKPVENDTEAQQVQQAPPDSFGYDQDAGAQNTDSGLRVNSTFNPATQGQITRDKIDDEKRSQYIQMVGSMVGTFLEASEDEPYVPMHPSAAKFYFSGDNYKSLKSQYQSMRPLIPKQPMADPNTYIEEMVSYYGPILGIKNRKSTFQDHPAYIQKEALELQEFVNSFQNYTTATGGNYVHAQQSEAPPQSMPQQQQPKEDNPQINPTSTGEEETDPFRAGLRSAFDNSRDMDTNFNIFDAGPNWDPLPGSSLQSSLQK